MSPTNAALLIGRLSSDPTTTALPSGDQLARFEVTVDRVDDRADSVPVSWVPAPARATTFEAGDEVVVVGVVRRRFFRAGGTVQSRTEVAARIVARPTHKAARAAVGELLAEVSGALDEVTAG